jgi:SPP1 family predicted phage head-tail adaptor
MAKLEAGALDERVAILTPGEAVDDGEGGWLPGPFSETPLWARVVAVSGREQVALGQTLNSSTYRVTLRQRSGITDKCRVRWKGLEYNVLACLPGVARDSITLTIFRSGN